MYLLSFKLEAFETILMYHTMQYSHLNESFGAIDLANVDTGEYRSFIIIIIIESLQF